MRASPTSFTHHTQQISKAAVVSDSKGNRRPLIMIPRGHPQMYDLPHKQKACSRMASSSHRQPEPRMQLAVDAFLGACAYRVTCIVCACASLGCVSLFL